MGDSDDENFVTFGNALEPLDEDNLPRKKAVTLEDQYALDPQGRRRFHGAFTGGFSAGYFNSVGTRDGWRPQQFKSSRSSKAGSVSQRPEDFMDEEDTSEFGIAPTGIRANSDFTDHGKRGLKRERQRQDNDGPIPGVPVLRELLKPVKDTVGVSLLKKMGWRPGQGIGPRVSKKEKAKTRKRNDKIKIYGCSLPNEDEKRMEETNSEASDDNTEEILFAPDDYEPFICKPKDNYFGIGYVGLDRRPVLSSHINLFETPASFNLQEKNKKLSIRGQAFGVGAFEADDEDIYQKDDMSRYDFSLGPKSNSETSRWLKNKSDENISKDNCIEGFVSAKEKLERKKIFEAPELPKNYEPLHVVRKSRFYPPIERVVDVENSKKKGTSRDLSAADRARILGESSTMNSQTPGNLETVGSKATSVACNIITRTLNLHGREKAEEKRVENSEKKSASWLEKLSSKSFISGGVEGKEDFSKGGNLKNLENFKADVTESQKTKPFAWDPEKQTRFEKFLLLLKKDEKYKFESLQPLSMTEWEREREKDEFDQAARIFEAPKLQEEEQSKKNQFNFSSDPTMSGKFVSDGIETPRSEWQNIDDRMKDAAKMNLFGKLTREVNIWQPASILCKRFNIPEPRSGCSTVEKVTKNKKMSIFDSLDFGSFADKFEGSTEDSSIVKESRIPIATKTITMEEKPDEESGSSSRIFDVSDIDASSSKSTDKMRSFEATYEKIFGRGETMTAEINATESVDNSNLKELENKSSMENDAKSKVSSSNDHSAQKKDLFKAIFLSSSEDSESDKEEEEKEKEDDSETIKSLLIGKAPNQMNLQRNTSPPRGIFAKLDFESLLKPGRLAEDSTKEEKSRVEEKRDEKELSESLNKNDNEKCKISSKQEADVLSMMYGPALPAKTVAATENPLGETSASSGSAELPKPIFKSVVVSKNDCSNARVKGKWVERAKLKKSKKTKHKHKHKEKERSRHKHKSKKDKR